MPNWWQQWAERIAVVLAEGWLGPRSDGAGEEPGVPPPGRPERHAEEGAARLSPPPGTSPPR